MVQAGGGSDDLEEESVVENVAEVLAINKLSEFEQASALLRCMRSFISSIQN